MKSQTLLSLETEYQGLRRQLIRIGYISKGSVFERPPGRGGSRFQWSTKVKAKTVSLTLSEEQFHWLKDAVDNQRKLEKTLTQMQRLTRQIMRLRFPDTQRRKRLSQKVLRLI